MLLLQILFIVFWVAGLGFFWRHGPWAQSQSQWGWAPHGYYMLMLAILGLAVFDGLVGRAVLVR